MADYDSINALNWSTLRLMAVSPRLLKHRSKVRRKDTTELIRGRGIHAYALEPDEWARYVVRPKFKGKGARGLAKEWASEHAGHNVVTAPEHARITACGESVKEHREAMAFLAGGRREEIVQWVDKETGLACKCRFDNIRPRDFTELKSTRRETPRRFLNDAAELLYHGALAWYLDGAIAAGVLPPDAEEPKVIAVSTSEPNDVFAFKVPSAAITAGRTLWQSLIRRFAQCQAADFWPGIAPGVLEYTLPPWADCGDGERWQEESF